MLLCERCSGVCLHSHHFHFVRQAKEQYQIAAAKAIELDNREVADECRGGVARTTLQLGDIRIGKQLALETKNKLLCKECARILENMGHSHVGQGILSNLHVTNSFPT